MKPIYHLLSVSALALSASLAQADTIGLFAGAGIWQSDVNGRIGSSSTDTDALGIDDDNTNYLYFAIEHPVPLLPNLLLKRTKLDVNGTSTLRQSFTADDVTFAAGTRVHSTINLDHTDFTLYYELLDNWSNLDLGLTLRDFDGQLSARSSGASETVELSGILPMLYAKGQFDLPFTGWSAAASANAIAYSGDQVVDAEIKVAYESDITPLIGLGLEAGYRHLSVELEDLDDMESDLTISGLFAGATLHF